MWPMVLRQIIQRVQTWMRRLWRSPRALSPASNPPVTPEQYQPDTRQFPMREEATASANNSQDAHPSGEPAKEFSTEVIPGRPGTEAGDDNLETPDNGGSSSPEALRPELRWVGGNTFLFAGRHIREIKSAFQAAGGDRTT